MSLGSGSAPGLCSGIAHGSSAMVGFVATSSPSRFATDDDEKPANREVVLATAGWRSRDALRYATRAVRRRLISDSTRDRSIGKRMA